MVGLLSLASAAKIILKRSKYMNVAFPTLLYGITKLNCPAPFLFFPKAALPAPDHRYGVDGGGVIYDIQQPIPTCTICRRKISLLHLPMPRASVSISLMLVFLVHAGGTFWAMLVKARSPLHFLLLQVEFQTRKHCIFGIE